MLSKKWTRNHIFKVLLISLTVACVLVLYTTPALNGRDYLQNAVFQFAKKYSNRKQSSLTATGLTLPPRVDFTHQPASRRTMNLSAPTLCVHRKGRLGNVMFVYASMLATALDKRMRPTYYEDGPMLYMGQFKGLTVKQRTTPCKDGFKNAHNKRHNSYNPGDIGFKGDRNIRMVGYYQSWKYFRNHFDTIRREFTFSDKIMTMARKSFEKTILSKFFPGHKRRNKLIYVTVHARRGDIVRKPGLNKTGFTSPNASYYVHAMDYFRKKHRNVLFLICSDTMQWAEQNLNFSDVAFVRGNTPDVDMAVMTMGNHTIMSVGSFGWWGSFLANGDTVIYAHPARARSSYSNQYNVNLTDFKLPHWVLME